MPGLFIKKQIDIINAYILVLFFGLVDSNQTVLFLVASSLLLHFKAKP